MLIFACLRPDCKILDSYIYAVNNSWQLWINAPGEFLAGCLMIELRDLQHLLSLHQHRHYSQAANDIGITQPALTKAIQRLEKQLGAKLFDRSSAQVIPTKIGEEVVARAQQILTNVGELSRNVDMMRGLQIGNLSVGLGPAMAESYTSQAIAQIAQQHPDIHINIRVDHWRQLTDWLLTGQLDLFVADITEASKDDRFLCTPLPSEPFVWFCRKGHPLASKTSISRDELLNYPIVSPKMPGWGTDWFSSASRLLETKLTKQAISTVQCESYAVLKRIVLASDCLSAALQSTVQFELETGAIAILPVAAPQMQTSAGIVRLRNRTPSPLANALIDQIQESAPQQA